MIIKTYKELIELIKAFDKDVINLMIICSGGGLGKSRLMEDTLTNEVIIGSHATPLSIYKTAYKNKGKKLVFDDVDSLLSNLSSVFILKQLCETKEEKTIRYYSTSPLISEEGNSYKTKSKAMILTNDIGLVNRHLKALMTRGLVIYFEPGNQEIYSYLENFGADKEIYNYLARFLNSDNFNLRSYIKAVELKKSGLDWKKYIAKDLEVDDQIIEIERLMQEFKTDKEREQHFSGSRATYFKLKKKYKSMQD